MDQDIRNTEGISYDNIIQIFNQLISTTIKYLVENSINIRSLFGNIDTVYRKMMSFDTLDDMEKYLVSFYKKIISCLSSRQSGESTRHIDRILRYLNANYKTEINFEEMAQSVGISYSYARKLVKEQTGKSLLDYTNILRIKEAKRLIRQTDQSMNEIAKTVGYSNVQSLTRFFKKYEGIPPADYKSCHHPAEQNNT
jgi:YesN/AraC family two-component response regulator